MRVLLGPLYPLARPRTGSAVVVLNWCAPVLTRLRRAFVNGVTAAATGAIAGAVFVLGKRALVDVPTVLIALAVFCILGVTRRIPEPVVIVMTGVAGLLLSSRGQ